MALKDFEVFEKPISSKSDSEHCDILYKLVLDLINCQKAEIEKLKTEIDKLENIRIDIEGDK